MKRASELFTNPTIFFDNAIAASNIQQGGLGDCYFLAVLCQTAEIPERIRARFVTN